MPSKYPELSFNNIKTYSLANRSSKIQVQNFAAPAKGIGFIDQLPNILSGNEFRQVVNNLYQCWQNNKTVLWMMGSHVIKCGLSPLIIQMMEKGIIKAIAFNGSGLIHDSEIAITGNTSEDVAAALDDGSFGMAKETADIYFHTINLAAKEDLGLGEVFGKYLLSLDPPYKSYSILIRAYELNIPVTVHVAIGTDITHMHPSLDGAALGKATLKDFRIMSYVCSKLNQGMVFNVGSNVILPEVFLKALNVARNLEYDAYNFTSVVFDMMHHYRPMTNVCKRPTQSSGKNYYIIGKHEILIPLLVDGVFYIENGGSLKVI
jgi:deoxyhypusine synthase